MNVLYLENKRSLSARTPEGHQDGGSNFGPLKSNSTECELCKSLTELRCIRLLLMTRTGGCYLSQEHLLILEVFCVIAEFIRSAIG